MTVYTHIESPQIAKLLGNYDLGELKDHAPIIAGLMNSNYRLQTTLGDYVLTIFEYVDTSTLTVKLDFEQYLANLNFPCCPAIADQSGNYIQQIANKPCKISKFAGGHPSELPNLEQCFAIGELLAHYHHHSKHFVLNDSESPRSDNWQFDIAEHLMGVLPVGDALLIQEEIGFQRLQKYDLIPKGIIHANTFTRNVLFDGNTITCLLDFYYISYDYYVADLAIAINAFAKDEQNIFSETKVSNIIDGYQHHRELSNHELRWINPLRRATALKIWLERLSCEYFPGEGIALPSQDPDEYKTVLKQLSEIPKP